MTISTTKITTTKITPNQSKPPRGSARWFNTGTNEIHKQHTRGNNHDYHKKIANIVKYASNYKNLDKYEGFCIKCGTKHKEVEPDAEKYPCKKCKKNAVYGLEEILIRLA